MHNCCPFSLAMHGPVAVQQFTGVAKIDFPQGRLHQVQIGGVKIRFRNLTLLLDAKRDDRRSNGECHNQNDHSGQQPRDGRFAATPTPSSFQARARTCQSGFTLQKTT